MNEHNGSRFAHITRAHPCFNEKMHDKSEEHMYLLLQSVIYFVTSVQETLTMKRTDLVLQDAL